MPPFGNLWNVKVFADRCLSDDRQDRPQLNAGSHSELVRLSYKDFERLVKPEVVELGVHEEAA
jgi:Ala-tRNA(Pro) deacylase